MRTSEPLPPASCKLCQQNKPLCRSHIVPEFLHGAMYDEKHRFFGLSSVPARRIQLFQKGLREFLLCEDCEQQFGRYEQYASRVFYGGTPITGSLHKKTVTLEDLDYKPLKLFFMSLLWRFGVTSIEYYKGASLGPHEERLRNMLQAEDPGNYDAYPCLVVAVSLDGKHIPDLIVPPALARIDGHWIWSLVVAGFLLTFYVSSHTPPDVLYPAFLKPDGTMILQIKDMTEIDFLYRFSREIAQAERTRKSKAL